MVKIRLRRTGAKMKPTYRVVVCDSRSPRDGAFLEILGHFNPRTNPETVVIDEERALSWLKQGAQPTATASRLLTKTGIMDKFKGGKETA
jgi:small subunit ribosomal protein S16